MIAAALALARRALPVLPLWWTDAAGRCACGKRQGACKAGKHPLGRLVRHGLKDASLDRRTIAAWWRQYPQANVAVATGGVMRLLVVDVDPDEGGEAALARLEHELGTLPSTVETITPRGGRHLYLIVPDGLPLPSSGVGVLGPGIDHRCEGGYAAAPPSAVAGKPYAWSVDSADRFAPAPDWLLDRLAHARPGNGHATPPEDWLAMVTRGVDEGARNASIARVAGLLFRRLVSRDAAEIQLVAELVACFNATKCRPPLGADELKRTIDSIAKRELRRRGFSS